MHSQINIKTHRLLLREFKKDDLAAVHSYASDAEVVRYMEWGPNSVDETREFISRVIENQDEKPRLKFELAILIENKLIGACNLTITNATNRQAFIGYCFNKTYWGKGYATEVAKELLNFGFNQLKLHRIYASCDVGNIASKKVLQKIGMTKEGHLRENKIIRGEWRDSFLFSILEQEYNNIKTV